MYQPVNYRRAGTQTLIPFPLFLRRQAIHSILVITIDPTIKPRSLQQSLWQVCREWQLPVAVWRLPQTDAIHLIVDLSGQPTQTNPDLEELPPGFAFSPFLNPTGEKSFFMAAHLHYTFSGEQWQEAEPAVPEQWKSRQESFQEQIRQALRKPLSDLGQPLSAPLVEPDPQEKSRFENLVREAVGCIEGGRFQKVVLSRSKRIDLPYEPNLLRVFHRMAQAYPTAFVSLVSFPGLGTWMGASPEILVSVDQHQIFRTVALAGTQALQPGISPAQATWTQKEIEEQALVSRYIINCFKHIRLREFEEDGPKTVVAGHLMHLRTDFTVDMQATGFPQLGTTMLRLLHPTSAVCGMPKDAALRFIREQEGYHREFYSGYLGPVNMEGESHLFVNLRCTQWLEKAAILYAGAGVTAHSNPEKEWRETELKCQTMLRVIAG